jgi:hypothetical protein
MARRWRNQGTLVGTLGWLGGRGRNRGGFVELALSRWERG